MSSKRWGRGDNSSGEELFDDNGTTNRIEYDYEGKTCFLEVPSQNNVNTVNSNGTNELVPPLY